MACFCNMAADAVTNRFNPSFTMNLPTVPLSLKLAAALPTLDPVAREDLKISMMMDAIRLPSISILGGPLMSIVAQLNMAIGNFSIDDLPMLELEMQQAADSFNSNIWPRLGHLASLKIQPLLNFALAARLALDLSDLGLDPFAMQAGDVPVPAHWPSMSFALTPPKLAMARLAAALPPLLNLNEALDLPPLGDTGAMQALQNRLNGLAGLTPPALVVPFPLIFKLALVLESLAKIEAAFGPDALSPAGMSRIQMMLKLWAKFPLHIPLGLVPLMMKLEGLPPMDDIRLGEEIAGSSGGSFSSSFSPPKLAISPFLNVMLALHASLRLAIDLEPWDMCSACNCPA